MVGRWFVHQTLWITLHDTQDQEWQRKPISQPGSLPPVKVWVQWVQWLTAWIFIVAPWPGRPPPPHVPDMESWCSQHDQVWPQLGLGLSPCLEWQKGHRMTLHSVLFVTLSCPLSWRSQLYKMEKHTQGRERRPRKDPDFKMFRFRLIQLSITIHGNTQHSSFYHLQDPKRGCRKAGSSGFIYLEQGFLS